MKTVKIQGGLGNQLFGLAFARSVAIASGRPVALDLSPYARDVYGRGFMLGEFARSLGAFPTAHRPFLSARALDALARKAPLPGLAVDRRPPKDERALRALIERADYFSGYWQDEAYILDPERYRAQVRRLIDTLGPRAPGGAVVIHYRTYKEERRRGMRRTPTGRFFIEALDLIERRTGPIESVSLLSDDPDLALSMLGDLGRPLIPATRDDPWEDMALMAGARALVLTNSSFSWWGGFCSDAACVVYPRPGGYLHYPRPASRFERL